MLDFRKCGKDRDVPRTQCTRLLPNFSQNIGLRTMCYSSSYWNICITNCPPNTASQTYLGTMAKQLQTKSMDTLKNIHAQDNTSNCMSESGQLPEEVTRAASCPVCFTQHNYCLLARWCKHQEQRKGSLDVKATPFSASHPPFMDIWWINHRVTLSFSLYHIATIMFAYLTAFLTLSKTQNGPLEHFHRVLRQRQLTSCQYSL